MVSNTVNDGENHKMSAVLTGKCILLSQKMNIIETSKKVIKILNRPIFKCLLNINTENFSLVG